MEMHSTNSGLESTVEPLEVQLEIPEARESDLTAGVAPQIISANIGESPTQIEEEKPDLTILQVRQLLSSSSYLLTVNH